MKIIYNYLMIKAIVSDFSWVLLFPKDKNYTGSLNALHRELSQKPNYNPLDYFELDFALLDFYRSLKDKVPVYMFTSDSIQDAPELQKNLLPVFEEILSAKEMNTHKTMSEAYRLVATHLDLSPDEILFIDDTIENIEAAKITGLITILYQNFELLHTEITKVLKL